MRASVDTPPLTTVQQCVVDALAAGSTLTDAAAAHGVHRVTVYRWMKSSEPFGAALRRSRAEFILARRDDLYQLSNRALETLLHILNNPESSPAVLLKTAMFILTRPQLPKTGWSMPEPAPVPDSNKLLDSAILEQDYAELPALATIEYGPEPDPPEPTGTPAQPAACEPPPPADLPVPAGPAAVADATECYTMQHESITSEHVAPVPIRQPGLASCPVPDVVLEARRERQEYQAILQMIHCH